MIMNSDYANKTIKNLNAEIGSILQAEEEGRTYSHFPAETPQIPDYNFAETQKRLNELRKKIAAIRHAVNVFNVETKLDGFDMTVDEGLGYMSMLNKEKMRLYEMTRIPETTRTRPYGSKEPDIVHRNFDIEEVRAAYQAASEELMRIQQAINIANLTKQFEVNVEL